MGIVCLQSLPPLKDQIILESIRMFGFSRLPTIDMITSELFGWFRIIITSYLADGEMMRFWLLLVKSIINQAMHKWTDNKETCVSPVSRVSSII